MAELQETLDWVSAVDITGISSAVAAGWSAPLVAVGSGGSLSAASHLARLQRVFFKQVATAATPSRLASEPIAPEASHWIFSAGGSNVDVVEAVRACELGEPVAVNVVTMRPRSRVADACRTDPFVSLHVLKIPSKKDGFLATNSLLAFCAVLSRCFLQIAGRHEEWEGIAESLVSLVEPGSASVLEWRKECAKVSSVEHLIVLHGGGTNLGGLDLESKLIEAGIKDVQLADYRHFAHGRHHWLAKNPTTTGILAFVSDFDRRLAERTLNLIPGEIPCAQIDVGGSGERSELGSLFAAFHITEELGFAQGIDPGQPGVPDFGRKIYGLRLPNRAVPSAAESAIRRKMRAQGPDAFAQLDIWRASLGRANACLESTSLGGVILDYDGTIVDTARRFEQPEPEVIAQLTRLIEGGFRVGIATGRGKSAGESLRAALPKDLWSEILIGYYNGAEILGLDETSGPDRGRTPTVAISNVYEVLQRRIAAMPRVQVDLRPCQLTLTPLSVADEEVLWTDMRELLDESDFGGLRLTRSSHSIDVIDRVASKLNLVSAMKLGVGTLRIGDRGRWPGNDFQLLDHPLGLSVDQVSGHPDHCWNLAPAGVRGTRATVHYLGAIKLEESPRIRLSLL